MLRHIPSVQPCFRLAIFRSASRAARLWKIANRCVMLHADHCWVQPLLPLRAQCLESIAAMIDQEAAIGLETLDYAAVLAYLALLFHRLPFQPPAGRHRDFFLGGRRMPWFAVGLSIMATLLSTNTYLGAPGEIIKYGPAYLLGILAYPVAAVIVIYLWIPFFMHFRLTSAYEYLERRFDRRARLLGGLLFLGLRLGWMSMVVYTASMAMVTMVSGLLTAVANFLGASHPIYPVIAAVGLTPRFPRVWVGSGR